MFVLEMPAKGKNPGPDVQSSGVEVSVRVCGSPAQSAHTVFAVFSEASRGET
ncbi:hypothetical protein HMPREF9440_00846 [Sutterella parvirubra YIT 11816]|uniref:Uncharacterized protein n=1 Tax=Sutterella parvirubra YIT 11816 TaxID=762967 RepID=H3KDN5_9BURK|nr:hypothetical protein HMPREF9440_00846 [Sutterella parvirubra YIT 11816]